MNIETMTHVQIAEYLKEIKGQEATAEFEKAKKLLFDEYGNAKYLYEKANPTITLFGKVKSIDFTTDRGALNEVLVARYEICYVMHSDDFPNLSNVGFSVYKNWSSTLFVNGDNSKIQIITEAEFNVLKARYMAMFNPCNISNLDL